MMAVKEWIKNKIKYLPFLALILLGVVFGIKNASKPQTDLVFGGEQADFGAYEQGQWAVYDKFSGFQTKADASKIDDGGNPNGQNTIINDGDRVSIRNFGSTLFGQSSTTEEYIGSLHTFRRRDGENIMLRSHGAYLEYYEEGNDTWEILTATSTSASYDFSDYNINTDLRSYVYFGNGVGNFSRWSGAHIVIGSAGVTSTATFIQTDTTTGLGFPTTGTITYCGATIPYTAVSATGFTVASAHACDASEGLAQGIEEFATPPKGNIYLVANNRLFISGITSTTQAVYFSKYGDATDFVGASLVTDTTADSPGIFNLGEGGGAVTGITQDEGAIYVFKKSIIYKITLDGDGLYTLVPLKPFDGNSQTTGATTNNSTFSGGNGIFFITPDEQIMELSRIEGFDYPQITPISDIIKPTIQTANFASSTGIFFQNNAYISARSDPSETTRNDTIFLWNDKVKTWESPIIGWSASFFTIYDDGNGEALYFGDSRVAQTYKVTDDAIDNELGITANWRSKRFDFGMPNQLKETDSFYIEGYASANTELTISLLYDENGQTQIYTTEFAGTEEDYFYDATDFNLFGFSPFGYKRFGSSDATESGKFRIYLNKNLKRIPFYNIQVELASDGVGQNWEITSYGFHVYKSTQPEDKSLYRAF